MTMNNVTVKTPVSAGSSAHKMTKRDYFNVLLTLVQNPDVTVPLGTAEFIQHEIEQLDKKSANKKPTAQQTANMELAKVVLAKLKEVGKPSTISDLQKAYPVELYDNGNITIPRLTAIMKKLMDEGAVVRTVDKKKALFYAGE